MSEKKRVLFVDDEPKILEGLRRMLRPLRNEWEMSFVNSGQEALDILAQQPFDVIVTDMRMPAMNGAELLHEVRKRYPHMVRFVLSGQASQETMLRSIGPMHQYLSKPCDSGILKSTLTRSCQLRSILSNEKLHNLVSRIDWLPSLPSLYIEMVEELQKPEASTKILGKLISKDIAMSAKILQLVNSAFFGVRQHISNLD